MKINQLDDNGWRHGTWEEYKNGQVSYRCNFRHGQFHGLVEDYSLRDYSYNYALLKGEFKKGKSIGLWYEKKYDKSTR
jgi:hypothetical protein